MEKSRVNSIGTMLDTNNHADFYAQKWVQDLTDFNIKPSIEYNFGRLYLGYATEEDAKIALNICDNRHILVEKSKYSYNTKSNTYIVVIICQLNTGLILPRCSINLGNPILD